jgi:hypothetical protein
MFCRGFMFYLCYFYLFKNNGIQHDFHIRWIHINSIQNLYQQYRESISTVYRIYINSIHNLNTNRGNGSEHHWYISIYFSTTCWAWVHGIQYIEMLYKMDIDYVCCWNIFYVLLIYIMYTIDIDSVYCWYRFWILLT